MYQICTCVILMIFIICNESLMIFISCFPILHFQLPLCTINSLLGTHFSGYRCTILGSLLIRLGGRDDPPPLYSQSQLQQ